VVVRPLVVLFVLAGCRRIETYRPTPGGRVYDLSCDEVRTVHRTETRPTGFYNSETTETIWTSTVPGLRVNVREVPRITAYTCGREVFDRGPRCPPGATCTETGSPLETDCTWTQHVVTDDGRVVIPCGSRSAHVMRSVQRDDDPQPFRDAGPPTPYVSGLRYRRAFVRIE